MYACRALLQYNLVRLAMTLVIAICFGTLFQDQARPSEASL